MGWFASAFKLELGLDQLWFVDPTLQAWDDSLSTHLQQLLINAPGTAGRECTRRILSPENSSLTVGRTIPARKLISMIAYNSIKDPTYSEQLYEATFAQVENHGGSIQDALEFVDALYTLLGEAPEGLFSETTVERKFLSQLRKCSHWQIKKDMQAFEALHMRNPNRHWEFFPQVLRRLQSSEFHRAQVAADVKSSAPPT